MQRATFKSFEESTQEEWQNIMVCLQDTQAMVADRVLEQLRYLEADHGGFPVNRLEHCLQTATLAERAGADDEMVVAALCHDVGKSVSVANHPAIAAEILRPYVRDDVYHVIRVHQDFQGRHYYGHFGGDPDARAQYRDEPWFDLAARFADEWDQVAFDPDHDTEPLAHFEARVRAVFAAPKRFV